MTDERIEWTGHPSQWQNLGWFVLCLLLIPIPFAIWKWLETRNTVYTLTDQRLKFTRGVFSKTTEDLELYRVRDTKFEQSLFERMVGLGAHRAVTPPTRPRRASRCRTSPMPKSVREKIRGLVEARRDAKRVRYLDAE